VPTTTYTLATGLPSALYTFVWSDSTGVISGAAGSSYTAIAPGAYTVQVTNALTGCVNSASATITPSLPPSAVYATASSYFADDQIVTVTVTPPGDYEYQLDNGAFQEGNQFSDLSSGTHTITVKDKYGCGSKTTTIRIIDYPKFFTPNDDGYNDTWNIFDLNGQANAKIYIFDRFGKLLKEISPSGIGWDGIYNGKPLPSTDYWFQVDYEENAVSKEFRSHFSLKR
jgi:gliding motility-associated-like protein